MAVPPVQQMSRIDQPYPLNVGGYGQQPYGYPPPHAQGYPPTAYPPLAYRPVAYPPQGYPSPGYQRLACKEINLCGHRGWRLRIVEAFIIILAAMELLYVMLVHARLFSSRYDPRYRENDYGMGAHPADTDSKGMLATVGETRV